MIIERREAEALRKSGRWVLVFGRRKTGKTFLVRNYLRHDEYFFVKRDKTVIVGSSDRELTYDAFREVFSRLLEEDKTVVVDEFHRLGGGFLDYLHYMQKKGRLVLVSSTFHLAKKILGKKSPLLGLFAEFPVGLIAMEDVATALKRVEDRKQLVELSILLREPLAIDYFADGKSSRETFAAVLSSTKNAVPALVGEVFTEEERQLSAVYEGILRAIASGKEVSTEISSFLFSRKLLAKDNPGSLQSYLTNLAKFGLVKRVKVLNRNSFVYRHVSPLAELYYYGDEKYNLAERPVDDAFVSVMLDAVLPRLVEAHVREFLAGKFGLIEGVVKERDYDVDGLLLKFGRPEIALEVKWKSRVSRQDAERAAETLSRVHARRRLLFVPDKRRVSFKPKQLEVVDIMDFL